MNRQLLAIGPKRAARACKGRVVGLPYPRAENGR